MFYYMRYKSNSSKLQLSFKKRKKFENLKNCNYNQNNSILISKHIIFYHIYYKLIRKYLKMLFSKSYMLKKYIKIWISIMTNFPISNKSKNARMGKGKGSLVTWACRLRTGHKIFTFIGISLINIKLILKYLNKIVPNVFIHYKKHNLVSTFF